MSHTRDEFFFFLILPINFSIFNKVIINLIGVNLVLALTTQFINFGSFINGYDKLS